MCDTTQTCRVCGEEKPITAFRFRNDNQKYRTNCVECQDRQGQASRYNITVGFIQELQERQGNKCAICGTHSDDIPHATFRNTLVVDHDHGTGAVRGLLCPSCNVILGHAKDDPTVLLRAALYLQEHTHG